jgi:trk system potassium uptake protein
MYTKWNINYVLKVASQILLYSSFSLLLPVIFSVFFYEDISITLTYSLIFLGCFFVSFLGYKLIKIKPHQKYFGLKGIHYLLIVCFVWLIYAVFSSLPFIFINSMSFVDAFFEAMSSLTTTGLSMIGHYNIPQSLIFWRSILSWFGGIGIILLAFFGITGKLTYSNKIFSAEGHERIRPSIKKTVFYIWSIYIILTLIGIIILSLSGMTLFDSVSYSMSAISTTGHGSSEFGDALLNTLPVQLSLIVIMLLGATSFITHYLFFKKKSIVEYIKDNQLFFMLMIIMLFFISIFIKISQTFSWTEVLMNIVGLITGGGFTNWTASQILSIGPFFILLAIILMFIGGSTNSTSGGIKIDRFIIFIKSIFWKIKAIVLPDIANFSRTYKHSFVTNKDVRNTYFFILVYLLFIIVGTTVLSFNNYGVVESFFEVTAAQSNVGVSVGITDVLMPVSAKVMLIINMWVGRLEIIPILGLLGMFLQKNRR